ncbi:HMGX3 protein, partial [Polypterus senegalus]|nr:HMGX3 protein [Polypterus senegalus]
MTNTELFTDGKGLILTDNVSETTKQRRKGITFAPCGSDVQDVFSTVENTNGLVDYNSALAVLNAYFVPQQQQRHLLRGLEDPGREEDSGLCGFQTIAMDDVCEGPGMKVKAEGNEGCYSFIEVSSPKKKKKCKGYGENTEKAKKPRSAYLLYYFDVHQSIQQEYPHLPQSEINKRISASWKQLNVSEKGYYLERAKLEKEGIDPDTRISGPSADLPGFRKILPRSSYVLIPKSSQPEERTSQKSELCLDQDEAETSATSSLSHDTLFSPIGLGSEVELPEQCIAVEGLTDEAAAVLSQSVALQQILSQYSSPSQDKSAAGFVLEQDTLELVGNPTYGAFGVVIEESVMDGSGSVAPVPPGSQNVDEGHLVTIIPNQEATEMGSTASTGLIVLPISNKIDSHSSPSFKLFFYHFLSNASQEKKGSDKATTKAVVNNVTSTDQHKGSSETSKPSLEASEAVTQLIVASASFEQREEPSSEWGEVLLPEVHGVKSAPQRDNGAVTKPLVHTNKQVKKFFYHFLSNASQEKKGSDKATTKAVVNNVTSTDQHKGSSETSKPSLEASEAVTQLIVASASFEQREEPSSEWGEVLLPEVHGVKSAPQRDNGAVTKPLVHTNKQVKKVSSYSKKSSAGITRNKSSDILLSSSPPRKHSNIYNYAISSAKTKGAAKHVALVPKRPVRAILPAPAQAGPDHNSAFVQWVTVQPEKWKNTELIKNKSKSVKQTSLKMYGLKPNTLKQLGHQIKQTEDEQRLPSLANVNRNESPEKGVKILSVLSCKHNPPASLELGLSTARGKGKCKNPSCDFVYKNRHKPQVCPTCGWDLTKDKQGKKSSTFEEQVEVSNMIDPYQPLNAAQKEIQRQSTLQLLTKTVLIPESEGELSETMSMIQDLNSSQVTLTAGNEEAVTVDQTGWPRYYESAATECALCNFALFKGGQSSVAGQEDCWLLTDSQIQTATIQLKICLNPQCLALHSFNDIHFVKKLNQSELCQVQELLYSGYWAFECLTVRDYNDMICGVCGIAPKVEIAQRNAETVLLLKNLEFTWPAFETSEEVNVDDFWSTIEIEAIEQAAFPSSIPITKFDASIIAPFFPPLMRSSIIVNTERHKHSCEQSVTGNIGAFVRLIHEGTLKPFHINSYSEKELREFLNACNIESQPEDTKEQMGFSLLALYAYIQNGVLTTKQPPSHITGGKLYKICPHQVICGSKYIVRGESARDHVDLLVSSRYWPPVYVVDIARQVAVSTDIWYPELAAQMWGKNQGCFSDPMDMPKYVSCPELLDQQYTMDMTVAENPLMHPITKSTARWIVSSEEDQVDHEETASAHHSMSLCHELEQYGAVIQAVKDSKINSVRQQPFTFDNAAYYYLYNRLIDYFTSKDIVNRQITDILQSCQPGEVVIRDTLYRLGVAQIKTELEPDEETSL